jgi:hypothetical protein
MLRWKKIAPLPTPDDALSEREEKVRRDGALFYRVEAGNATLEEGSAVSNSGRVM